MWLESPETRQKWGRAVINLTLKPNVQRESDDEFIHEFSTNVVDIKSFGFDVGTYVIVSTSKRYAIDTGPVISITESTVILILHRYMLLFSIIRKNFKILFILGIYVIDTKTKHLYWTCMNLKQIQHSICRIWVLYLITLKHPNV